LHVTIVIALGDHTIYQPTVKLVVSHVMDWLI